MIDLSPLLHRKLSRLDRISGLAERFPTAAPPMAAAPPMPAAPAVAAALDGLWARGGRTAAVERLAAIDPEAYGRSRNHLGGAVTRLSPWLRHGVLSLAEVRDAALARVSLPEDAAKLISELGWRDYWQQVQAAVGDRIHEDLQPPAQAALRAGSHATMPADVLAAETGMACIDAFVRKLQTTGWLHNHERMWLASWLVHARGVRWQTAADWFLTHLLDGDPSSNHLSWQWIAGTFSAKPYLFNRENLETFSDALFCQSCGVRGGCDVEGSYETLTTRFFGEARPAERPPLRIPPPAAWPSEPAGVVHQPLVLLTLDSAAATSPAAVAYPESPRLFVLDPHWLADERPSLGRLLFLFECLADVPDVQVVLADPREAVPAIARLRQCDGVAVAETTCPRIRRAAEAIRAGTGAAGAVPLPLVSVPWPRFCDRARVRDLGRFSRYWQEVRGSAMKPTPAAAASRADRP